MEILFITLGTENHEQQKINISILKNILKLLTILAKY